MVVAGLRAEALGGLGELADFGEICLIHGHSVTGEGRKGLFEAELTTRNSRLDSDDIIAEIIAVLVLGTGAVQRSVAESATLMLRSKASLRRRRGGTALRRSCRGVIDSDGEALGAAVTVIVGGVRRGRRGCAAHGITRMAV